MTSLWNGNKIREVEGRKERRRKERKEESVGNTH
jgi:hypothetical protein